MTVAAAVLLPLVYLAVRTIDAGSDAWDVLFRLRVLEILGRTLLLVGAVTAALYRSGRSDSLVDRSH